jgi:hypothetical protein
VTILAENFSIAKIPGRKSAIKVDVDIEYKSYEKYLAPGRFIRLAFRYSTSKDSKLGFIALPITDPRPQNFQRFLTGYNFALQNFFINKEITRMRTPD